MYYSYYLKPIRKSACWIVTMLCMIYACNVQAQGGVSASQYQALVSLYTATDGANWFSKDNWLSMEPVATWYGVTVDSTGNVIALNLSYNNLTGKIPASLSVMPLADLQVDGNQLSRIIALPSALVSLSADNNVITVLPALPSGLRSLRVNSNQLKSLPSLPSGLKILDASSNLLSTVPSLPAGLTNLAIGSNKISALPSLPASLTSLNISNNRISSLPVLPANLGSLIASTNRISSLPVLPATLTYLNVSGNRLSALPALPAGLSFSIVNENRLTFEDLEPIVNRFFGPGFYAPQADIGSEGIVVTAAGCAIQLSANYAGNTPNSRYVWFKDSTLIDTLTTPYLTLNPVTSADAGTYTAQVINTVVPGLVLNRKPVYLYVYGSAQTTASARMGVKTPALLSENTLSVGPNPFSTSVSLVSSENPDQTVNIMVTDLTGRVVYQAANHKLSQPVEMGDNLPEVMYILHVTSGAKTQKFPIVKQK